MSRLPLFANARVGEPLTTLRQLQSKIDWNQRIAYIAYRDARGQICEHRMVCSQNDTVESIWDDFCRSHPAATLDCVGFSDGGGDVS